jgi:hypothetical protein
MPQSIDEIATNGSQSIVEITSKEQAKALHAQLNRFYRKGKKSKAKPVLKPRGKVIEKQISIAIEESATDWDDIEDEPFSLDANASRIYVKTGKEKMKCVNTGKSQAVGGAAVYRVFL